MKRLATLAGVVFASLIGTFAFTAPAHATFSCTTPTVSAGAYPQGYLWYCEDPSDPTTQLTAGTKTDSKDALQRLGNNSTAADDVKSRMANNLHHVYIFKTYALYLAYATTNGSNAATPPIPKEYTFSTIAESHKWDDSGTIKQQSIIIEDLVLANSAHTNIGNTTAHEAGHQMDGIYGDVRYTPAAFDNYASIFGRDYAFKLTGQTVTFTTSATVAGTVLNLGFEPAGGSAIPLSHTTDPGGQTTNALALVFESKINNDTGLQALGVTAVASGATVKVYSNTILKYTSSATGITKSSYDWQELLTSTTPQCSRSQGLFNGFKDSSGNEICGSLQAGLVGGSSFAGEYVYVTITDNAINNGGFNFKTIPGPVGPGQTTTQIAAYVAAAINADTTLNPGGGVPQRFYATSSGANVYITSSTGNTTTYAFGVSGTHETFVNQGINVPGDGEKLANTYSGMRSDQVLQTAWSYYFTPQTLPGGTKLWTELFAEQAAIRSGMAKSGSQTPDNWLGAGEFICSNKVVEKLGVTGQLPVAGDYATQCK